MTVLLGSSDEIFIGIMCEFYNIGAKNTFDSVEYLEKVKKQNLQLLQEQKDLLL